MECMQTRQEKKRTWRKLHLAASPDSHGIILSLLGKNSEGDSQGGRKIWKKLARYHRRSLAETAMYRFKSIFGEKLKTRKLKNQRAEA